MDYVALIGAHLTVNAHSLEQADENIAAGRSRNDSRTGHNLWDTIFTERAFVYVDNIPKFVEKMVADANDKPLDDAQSLEDAWWMLMVRMQCVRKNPERTLCSMATNFVHQNVVGNGS